MTLKQHVPYAYIHKSGSFQGNKVGLWVPKDFKEGFGFVGLHSKMITWEKGLPTKRVDK